MKNTNIIASAGSIQALEKLINEYFFSTSYKVRDDLTVYSEKKGDLSGFRVCFCRGRYRFKRATA